MQADKNKTIVYYIEAQYRKAEVFSLLRKRIRPTCTASCVNCDGSCTQLKRNKKTGLHRTHSNLNMHEMKSNSIPDFYQDD